MARTLAPGQRCEVRIASIGAAGGGAAGDGARDELVLASRDVLLEAPNWTLDGRALILNGDGALWRLELAGGSLTRIPIEGVAELNNDHVLAPDGVGVYVSSDDGHIWRAPLAGGRATRVTNETPGRRHYLHGVSPDGATLAYVGVEARPDGTTRADIFTIPASGGADARLTDTPHPADGCEFTPDGVWIVFNTEQFGGGAGGAQLARMRPDGSELEQLTDDDRVNWFPHVAPDGRTAVYLSYPAGTTGHPADLPVELRLVRGGRWREPEVLARLHGGQGTINVASWAPTSDRLAYVAYPLD